MKHQTRLYEGFFMRDVLEVAPDLIGKYLVRSQNGTEHRFMITEVEAYRGMEDLACHASKGRTSRTEIMFARGGYIYVYLIYGMYWMLNFVTGYNDEPQAVLIRGVDKIKGPGRLTRQLKIDKTFYGESLMDSNRLWLENHEFNGEIITTPRIGIDYSGELWKNKPWRFLHPHFS